MKHVAVVGSRKFIDFELLNESLKELVKDGDVIVSGGAIGADTLAQEWAKKYGHSIIIHYPDYAKWGNPAANFVRNKHIAEDADIVLAFYAHGAFGKGGTANTVGYARKMGKTVYEFEDRYEDSGE